VAGPFLQRLAPAAGAAHVELRCDDAAFQQLTAQRYPQLKRATESDWNTEFLDLILAVRVVDSDAAAIEHIEQHGSHHSDCIVTSDPATAERFLNSVDSAVVYWNASTPLHRRR
jgi:glutamate-5-semialdehyde dehydrogenase